MFGLNPYCVVFFAIAYPILEDKCFCTAFPSPSSSNNFVLASFEGNHLVNSSPGLRTQDTLAYPPEMNQAGTGIERRRGNAHPLHLQRGGHSFQHQKSVPAQATVATNHKVKIPLSWNPLPIIMDLAINCNIL